jgi:hypothetical protein
MALLDDLPTQATCPCPLCCSTSFWRAKGYGLIQCRYCTPPPAPFLVEQWLEAVPDPAGGYVLVDASVATAPPADAPFEVVSDWWFSVLTEEDYAYARAPFPRKLVGRVERCLDLWGDWQTRLVPRELPADWCPWCGRQGGGHTEECQQLHDAWDLAWPWGKHKGQKIRWLATHEPDYLRYFLRKPDLRGELRTAIERALQVAPTPTGFTEEVD